MGDTHNVFSSPAKLKALLELDAGTVSATVSDADSRNEEVRHVRDNVRDSELRRRQDNGELLFIFISFFYLLETNLCSCLKNMFERDKKNF